MTTEVTEVRAPPLVGEYVCPQCGATTTTPGSRARDGTALEPVYDPLLGRDIHGYLVASRLGRGGMGCVYRAIDPAIDAQVAIKCLRPKRWAMPCGSSVSCRKAASRT